MYGLTVIPPPTFFESDVMDIDIFFARVRQSWDNFKPGLTEKPTTRLSQL